MSDSVRPHRRQPTRLPHPWDSPGKNTEVGCHFLLQCMKVKSESEVAQSCLTLRAKGGKSELEPIFYLPIGRVSLSCCLVAQSCPTLCNPMNCSLPGSSVHGISQARIQEWVAISSSRGSSQPRNQIHISYIGRWILYH